MRLEPLARRPLTTLKIARRTLTVDRQPVATDNRKRFYTTEQLGTTQSLTPEGFLLCENVPLARTGSQLYGAHELPGMRAKNGLINIVRDEEEVFKPEAVSSFAGKPVTNDHPPEKVTPDNHKKYSVGVVLNPRRGEGDAADRLFADLLITDPIAIKDIRGGKREVSAGYDAEYEQTTDGEGRQYSIIGNHVALVRKGRCGPLCSIGDSEMAGLQRRVLRRSFKDRVLDAINSGDEGALVEELDKVEQLMGEQVSGRDADPHHGVVINLNHSGGAGGMTPQTPDTHDEPEAGAGAGGAAAASSGGAEPTLAEVMQRLDRIEQAIVILAQGDDDGDGDDDDMGADPDDENNDGFHDEAATEPDSDDPEQKPSNNLTYGTGTGGNERRSNQLGASDRRGTRDRRRSTRDHAAPSEDGRQQHFVGDSTSMHREFQDTIARAELLVTGYSMPTFDAKQPAKMTFDTLCSLRRNVLERAYHDTEKRNYIDTVAGGGDRLNLKSMTCDAVSLVFNGASELARQANNRIVGHARTASGAAGGVALTAAEINRRNREKYGVQ